MDSPPTSLQKKRQTKHAQEIVPVHARQDKRVLKRFPKQESDDDRSNLLDVGKSPKKPLDSRPKSETTVPLQEGRASSEAPTDGRNFPSRLEVPPVLTSDNVSQVMMTLVVDTKAQPPQIVLVDSGAIACVLPWSLARKYGLEEAKLAHWSGMPLSSFHRKFDILGELRCDVMLGNDTFPVRWCVVADDVEPVLGMDFIAHYHLSMDWNRYGYRASLNGCDTFIPLLPKPLRACNTARIKSGVGSFVTCYIDSPFKNEFQDKLYVEPSNFTRGAFRTMCGVTDVNAHGKVEVFVTNWDNVDVDILPNALLGYCAPAEVTPRVEGAPPPNSRGVKSFEEYNAPLTSEVLDKAIIGDGLTRGERSRFVGFLKARSRTFAPNPSAPPVYKRGEISVEINTGDAAPIKERVRKMSPVKAQEVNRQVKEMLQNGIVSPSKSPWGSPVVLAKKSDGTWRFCVDYRGLNKVTRKDAYPLPPIQTILDALGVRNARVWSTMDAASGFWQLPMKPEDREKTSLRHFGRNSLYGSG